MKRNLQLMIPAPCHENWEQMQPEEQGRFCAACRKTVVDLSVMSDREIIVFLARAGQGVCGRLAPEQLNRPMAVAPLRERRWKMWWHWVVAALLVSGEARAQHRVKVEVVQQPVRLTRVPVQQLKIASIPERIQPPELSDSFKVKVLPTATVVAGGYLTGFAGGLIAVRCQRGPGWIKDSLAVLGIAKKELEVYPNPARRGGTVSLSWQGMETGEYEVGLFSSSGEMIQRRVMSVCRKEQIDLLEVPGSLAAGVYFLRASKAGEVKVTTKKIIVL